MTCSLRFAQVWCSTSFSYMLLKVYACKLLHLFSLFLFLFSYLGFSPFPFFFCFLSFWFLWSSPCLLGFHSACQHHDWVFPVILLPLAFWLTLSTLVNAWSWPRPMASSWWSQWGCCQHMLLLKVVEHVSWVLMLFKLLLSVGYVFSGGFLCSLGLVFHFSAFLKLSDLQSLCWVSLNSIQFCDVNC